MNSKSIATAARSILLTLVSVASAFAAGEVDTSFSASLTKHLSASVSRSVVQPDGKILIAGNFRVVNRIVHNGIARLNADGTLDTTFNSPDLFRPGDASPAINDIALQSNGKILVGGIFTAVGGTPRHSIFRLNADGTLDTTFPQEIPNFPDFDVYQIHVYPDDRFLVGGRANPPAANNVKRFNADGTADPSFTYSGDTVFNALTVQPDGKIVVSARSTVRRYNSNGSPDATFAEITLQENFSPLDLEYLADGKILMGGFFGTVNGAARRGLFRANPDGTIDGTFPNVQMLFGGVNVITRDASGKFYVGGTFSQIWGNAYQNIARLNADGTLDPSFHYATQSFFSVNDIDIEPDGNLLVSGSYKTTRVSSTGVEDPTFSVDIVGIPATGFKVLVQPDNKVLVAGQYNLANGVTRNNLSRLNADGTLDTVFAPASTTAHQLLDLALQPDGKILVAGSAGTARRLNADGTLDVVLDGTTDQANNYWEVEYLSSGKILLAGPNLRRFNSDGSSDGTLATITSSFIFPFIYKVAVQPDGKIVIVGNFNTVNGTPRNRIARLNADGTLDMSFNPVGANNDVNSVALQSDGKILVGGLFTSFNSDANKKYIARLNPDGSLDSSFTTTSNGSILDFKIQTDGKILLGGGMSAINGGPHAGIARLNADATLDSSFNPGTNSSVWSIAQQSDGKIIYAGQFFRTNGISTIGIGRLLNSTVQPHKLFDYDGDGRADVSVFRPSENKWYILRSSDSSVTQQVFAIANDIPVPADYDGDGKTDIAVYRPSNGAWWYSSSLNGAQINVNWGGESGDIPRPSDFDGDGKTDFVFFRPTNNFWYRITSAGTISNVQFGSAGDKPVRGDFDGDGKWDVAIYRPSTGDWWYQSSISNAQLAVRWGISTDIPAPADFDGDGKTDFAVYRPSTGVWYIINSTNGSFTIGAFGISEDKPIPADYDGDGKADISVFRPSTGIWYMLRSTSGFGATQWGIATDIPTENAFIP